MAVAVPGLSPAAASEIVDRIVANVNGEIILLSDLRQQLALLKNLQSRAGAGGPDGGPSERLLLQSIIDEKIMAHYAKELNVSVKESEVDKAVEDVKSRNNLTDKTLEAGLREQGATFEQFRERLRNQILIQRISSMEITGVSVSMDEAREYYEGHKSEFMKPGQVRASHIILLATENSDPERFKQARQRIDDIFRQIRDGADFAEMARRYSEDGSAPNGGDLGWFSRGKMLPVFEEMAFSLGVGQVGGPVSTQFGFHLIKVTDRKEPVATPFEQVAGAISRRLENDAYQKKQMAWIQRLRDQAYIEILY